MSAQSAAIVVPAYNEGRSIARVVSDLVSAHWPVVVVDDGSVDDTSDVAASAGATVLRHVVNRGQGAALQTGIDYAVRSGAQFVVTFDADGQHSVGDIPQLIAALADADVALGSRFLGTTVGASSTRRGLLRAAVRVSNWLSGMQLTDAHCGLRAFRASVIEELRITQDRMAHASQLLRNMRKHRLRVKEVPVTVHYTEYSRQKGQSGIQAVKILFDYFFRTC